MKKENDLKIIQGWSDEKIKAGYEGLIKLVGENKHLRQFDSEASSFKQFNDMFNDLREKLKSIDWDKVKEGARRFDEQHKRIKNGYLIKGKNLSGYLHKKGLIPTDGEHGLDDFINWFYRAYGQTTNPMPDVVDRHILEYSIQRESNLDCDLIFIRQPKEHTIESIFNNDLNKINILREAINDLNIIKDLSERNITGFIDGAKAANCLPQIENTVLMRIIYKEIGKDFTDKSKPRYENNAYFDFVKSTKKYFNIR